MLSDLPRIEGNSYLVPGGKDGAPRADLKRPWASIVKAAKLEGVRIHDLRHSFASIGAGASMGLPIIGRLLGHSQPQTTANTRTSKAIPFAGPPTRSGQRFQRQWKGSEDRELCP